jgi:hypothetical protein
LKPVATSYNIVQKVQAPTDIHRVRSLVKDIHKESGHITSNVKTLITSLEQLVIQNECLLHENQGLKEALVTEAKRRKRNKPLGLLSSEEAKFGAIWSPTKVNLKEQEILAKEQLEEQLKKQKEVDK